MWCPNPTAGFHPFCSDGQECEEKCQRHCCFDWQWSKTGRGPNQDSQTSEESDAHEHENIPSVSLIIPLQKMTLKSMTPSEEESSRCLGSHHQKPGRHRDPGLQDFLNGSTALDPRFQSLPDLEEDCSENIQRCHQGDHGNWRGGIVFVFLTM